MLELWRPIPGYEGFYEAGDLGNIRSVDRIVNAKRGLSRSYPGRVLRQYVTKTGRRTVNLSKKGKTRTEFVHRLVLSAFKGECPEGWYGCHKDGNASNNRLNNLRWDTPASNSADARLHGTQVKGETHGMTKLSEDAVRAIRASSGSAVEIGKQFGVSDSAVRLIRKRRRWAHII